MTHQHEINYPENVEFSGGQIEKYIDTNYPFEEEVLQNEYNRPTEKYYRDNPEFRKQVNISKVEHKFLPKQTI